MAHAIEAWWNTSALWKGWGHVWKLRVHERVKIFAWMMCHDRVLTNVARNRRGLSSNASGSRCSNGTEDLIHLIRDCVGTSEVWKNLIPSPLHSKFSSTSLQNWLELNLWGQEFSHVSHNWPEKWSIICWWLWKWRNEEVVGRELNSGVEAEVPRRQNIWVGWSDWAKCLYTS